MATHGIIVAAGTGTRFSGDTPKQLARLHGLPVLAWSLRAFVGAGIQHLTVVAPSSHFQAIAAAVAAVTTATVVTGGATRSESVRLGLEAADADPDDIVLVHDAARPLVTSGLVAAVAAAVTAADAVTPAIAVVDTVVEASSSTMGTTLDRKRIRRVQTPQGFKFGVLAEAHRRALEAGEDVATDDAGLVRRHLEIAVQLIEGEAENLKITTAADLEIAAALLARRLG